ncbi:diaminopimelate epimerase [Marinivivus vitaminiproducens]|uniref:diaminopimelate epimerase n=1 Tax=Marinivivus vitaminiproducens TaxID=3035935 RepID=UPI0027AA019D|nr:diaminopimelate epimerase [Geminicoccaceae bacterium SCSIO 64248]
MSALAFRKMHGLGNDFVILDGRDRPLGLDTGRIVRIADRHRGVGCDQLIVLDLSPNADVFMRIFNPDGSEAGACGNAARCVAALVARERGFGDLVIETIAGLLPARVQPDGVASVEMGVPRLDWHQIPLSEERDTLHLGIEAGPLADPVGVGMGNPHAVFFVPDVAAIDIAGLGPQLERHPLFPDRANIGVAQVLAPDALRLRVWERGAGLTLACGSGACAALVAAVRRGLVAESAELHLDGGRLTVSWPGDGRPVRMTGPYAHSFEGRIDPALFAGMPE